MGSAGDEEVDEMAQKIMSEIEQASSKELAESNEMIEILHLTNVRHAKTLLQHMDEAHRLLSVTLARACISVL